MPTVQSQDGTHIGYTIMGEGGPPVILVDPAGGFRGFGLLTPLAEQLASDFTAITYDRRGRGESGDTLPYAVEREIEDLAAVIGVAGGSPFVYGFSSGAILALWAAADGLPIDKLALLEPPLAFEPEPEGEDLGAEVAELVAAGRRGDAFMHFNRSIGVPEDILEGMPDAPWWPAAEALAHTLVYDTRISAGFTVERLASITTPTLVVDSTASDERLHEWATASADALPNGVHRTLEGEWHGVAPEILAPVMRDFYLVDQPALSATSVTG